jgi:hypothetical protein
MQTMLQVWQKAPYISPKGGRQKGMPHDRQHEGIFVANFYCKKKQKCTKPERLCRRAEKLVAGVLKVAEMNEAELCGMNEVA